MKRIFLLACALGLAVPAPAQTQSTQSQSARHQSSQSQSAGSGNVLSSGPDRANRCHRSCQRSAIVETYPCYGPSGADSSAQVLA